MSESDEGEELRRDADTAREEGATKGDALDRAADRVDEAHEDAQEAKEEARRDSE
jgi:hypothetical protein